MSTQVALGKHFEAFVAEQIHAGHYQNSSEIIRASLGLLEDQNRLREVKLSQLRAAILAGSLSGEGLEADALFDKLSQKYAAPRALDTRP
jgi:antitoxin ParD1/3/4